MDYKRRLILYICLFTCVGIWNFISSADIGFTKYQYESSLFGYRCVPNETAFEMDNVFDPVRCCNLCKLDNMCLSVFYQPDSHKCTGCRRNPQMPTCRHESYPGSEHFRSKQGASESDCKDLIENDCYTTSGLYEISLWMSKKIVTVFCDMETDGGGWTVLQNRFDGSTDFYRNFDDYEKGFGELNGEFWMGLEALQEMTSQGKTELRLDLTAANGSTGYEIFQNFYVDESPRYTLHIEPGNGTLGDEDSLGLLPDNGAHFSTYDVDQDTHPKMNMADEFASGWWHDTGTQANLNGKYFTPGRRSAGPEVDFLAMFYYKLDALTSLKSTKMMFRRVDI